MTDTVVPMKPAATEAKVDATDALLSALTIYTRLRLIPKPTTQTVKEMIAAAKAVQALANGPMDEALALHDQMRRDLDAAIGIEYLQRVSDAA